MYLGVVEGERLRLPFLPGGFGLPAGFDALEQHVEGSEGVDGVPLLGVPLLGVVPVRDGPCVEEAVLLGGDVPASFVGEVDPVLDLVAEVVEVELVALEEHWIGG